MSDSKTQKELLKHCSQILERLGHHPNTQDLEMQEKARAYNSWFTLPNIQQASQQWAAALQPEAIDQWLQEQPLASAPKTVALVLAGNIPWVGLHDMLAVLVSGHKALVKCSSDDPVLLPYLVEQLPKEFSNRVQFTQERIQNFDAVIATGSDNAARYFEAYFQKYPHIIRKNRNAVAILSGKESDAEMEALGRDILTYFGKGCRNVTHLYLPEGFDLNRVFGGIYLLADIIQHHSYANNYDYYKALYLMNDISFLENGFFLLKEDSAINSPLATAHYTYYTSLESLQKELIEQKDAIQCVVGQAVAGIPSFALGEAQAPALWDYADGVNTLEFLKDL